MSCSPALATLTVPVKVIAMTTPNTTSVKLSVGSRAAPRWDPGLSAVAMVEGEDTNRSGSLPAADADARVQPALIARALGGAREKNDVTVPRLLASAVNRE
jgi:hypothetical protein